MQIKSLIDSQLAYRNILSKKIKPLEDYQLDAIPEGFSNNIRWQTAHIIATQALLSYGKLGYDIPMLNEEFILSVKKGTFPSDMKSSELFEKENLIELLSAFPQQVLKDYSELNKNVYKPYETSSGLVLDKLGTALSYVAIHDGMHLGNILALIKLV